MDEDDVGVKPREMGELFGPRTMFGPAVGLGAFAPFEAWGMAVIVPPTPMPPAGMV
jgi:hypothetical protein